MIFGKLHKFLLKSVPRKRVRLTMPKIPTLRGRGLNRAWIYLYALFVLGAPFSHAKVVAAPIMPPPPVVVVDERVVVLEGFLAQYDSPLTPHAETFIEVSDRYGLDWRLLPAIAGTESTFGLRYIRGTYNPFGWGSGRIYLGSWDNGIETVGEALWEKYLLKGKRPLTVEGIGSIYAESPHWPRSVRYWMGKIDAHQLAER